MFMSAQHILCFTIGGLTSGITGAKEARLMKRRHHKNRIRNFIARIVSHLETFASRVDGSPRLCYLVVDGEPDRDLVDDDGRGNYGTSLRFGSDLHCFGFTSSKSMQARLLRQSNLLRDLQEKCSADFPTAH